MSTAIVIDSSALVAVVARTARSAAVTALARGRDLVAPDLVNPEVLSVLRRWRSTEVLSEQEADRAVRNLRRAPVTRFPTDALLDTMWGLRHSVSAYDAAFVSLARTLGRPLLIADARLGRAPGLGIELLQV